MDGTGNDKCDVNSKQTASMAGFVQTAISDGHSGKNEMSMWESDKVPILTTLANE